MKTWKWRNVKVIEGKEEFAKHSKSKHKRYITRLSILEKHNSCKLKPGYKDLKTVLITCNVGAALVYISVKTRVFFVFLFLVARNSDKLIVLVLSFSSHFFRVWLLR